MTKVIFAHIKKVRKEKMSCLINELFTLLENPSIYRTTKENVQNMMIDVHAY